MDITYIITALFSYILGIATGFFFRRIIDLDKASKNSKTVVTFVIVFIWFASMSVELFNPAYHTSPFVHGLMGTIVGFFYKFEAKK